MALFTAYIFSNNSFYNCSVQVMFILEYANDDTVYIYFEAYLL
jgi:hypothetical protein